MNPERRTPSISSRSISTNPPEIDPDLSLAPLNLSPATTQAARAAYLNAITERLKAGSLLHSTRNTVEGEPPTLSKNPLIGSSADLTRDDEDGKPNIANNSNVGFYSDQEMKIKHGFPIRKRQGEEMADDSKTFQRRKRQRFKLKGIPEGARPKWKMLLEIVRLDYVQKGPDKPSAIGEKRGNKLLADTYELELNIKNRYRQIFGETARPMTPKELEGVFTSHNSLLTFV